MTISQFQNSVSRETYSQFEAFVGLHQKWAKSLNLVSKTSELWDRHVIDSSYLYSLLGEEKKILDIGSGGGFPAIILACMKSSCSFTLVESDRKKVIFLKESVRVLGLKNVEILNERVENLHDISFDIIMARAVASLSQLLYWSESLLTKDGYCLFPKGENYATELEESQKLHHFNEEVIPSKKGGVIIKIMNLAN